MERIPIISAMYVGPVEAYRLLAGHSTAIVDIGEHYERQSYRTRTSIVGPNGVQDLVVQIQRRHGEKMLMRTVELSRSESWPQQHVHALRSAYGKSPWGSHFLDELEHLLLMDHDRLVDLDLELMRRCMKWSRINCELQVSGEHVTADPQRHLDLRAILHPKKPLPATVDAVPPYPQVFADRHGFRPRLSMIDLLCNSGPHALQALRGG